MKKQLLFYKFLFILLGLLIVPKITMADDAPGCTSRTYSDWSVCQLKNQLDRYSGQQNRTILSRSPEGCVNYMEEVLVQSCNYVSPCSLDDYDCSDWSDCSQTGTQMRTCFKISDSHPTWRDRCEGGVSMPETTKSCSYVPNPKAQIQSISPIQGAIGDQVTIMLPYITDIFSKCYSTGIYATHELSAKVYFNNIEAKLKQKISGYASGGGTPIYALVPTNATTGKIKVELLCKSEGGYGDFDYNATLLSTSDYNGPIILHTF